MHAPRPLVLPARCPADRRAHGEMHAASARLAVRAGDRAPYLPLPRPEMRSMYVCMYVCTDDSARRGVASPSGCRSVWLSGCLSSKQARKNSPPPPFTPGWLAITRTQRPQHTHLHQPVTHSLNSTQSPAPPSGEIHSFFPHPRPIGSHESLAFHSPQCGFWPGCMHLSSVVVRF
jgi:hypothetical protein